MHLANKYIQVTFENVQIAFTYATGGLGQGGMISMTDADILKISNSLI